MSASRFAGDSGGQPGSNRLESTRQSKSYKISSLLNKGDEKNRESAENKVGRCLRRLAPARAQGGAEPWQENDHYQYLPIAQTNIFHFTCIHARSNASVDSIDEVFVRIDVTVDVAKFLTFYHQRRCLACQPVGWPACWPTGWLADRPTIPQASWLAGQLASSPASQLPQASQLPGQPAS